MVIIHAAIPTARSIAQRMLLSIILFLHPLDLVLEVVHSFPKIKRLLLRVLSSCPAHVLHDVAKIKRQIAADVLGFYAIREGVVASLADSSSPLGLVSLVWLWWWRYVYIDLSAPNLDWLLIVVYIITSSLTPEWQLTVTTFAVPLREEATPPTQVRNILTMLIMIIRSPINKNFFYLHDSKINNHKTLPVFRNR